MVAVPGHEILAVAGVVAAQAGRSAERARVASLGVVDGIGLDLGAGGGERGEEVEGSGLASPGIRAAAVGLTGLEGLEVALEDGGSVENVASEGRAGEGSKDESGLHLERVCCVVMGFRECETIVEKGRVSR